MDDNKTEKNWRVVMMVANTTAPYRLMVKEITICTAAEQMDSAPIHHMASGWRMRKWMEGTSWLLAMDAARLRPVDHAVVYSTWSHTLMLYPVKRESCLRHSEGAQQQLSGCGASGLPADTGTQCCCALPDPS